MISKRSFIFNCLILRKKSPYSELFWSVFFQHFPAFGLNTPYSVRVRENAGKIRTRITPNTDTFCAVRSTFLTVFYCNLKINLIVLIISEKRSFLIKCFNQKAAFYGSSTKLVFLKILQYSKEYTSARKQLSKESNSIKKRLQHSYYPVNIAKFLATAFFIKRLWWLLQSLTLLIRSGTIGCPMPIGHARERKTSETGSNFWVRTFCLVKNKKPLDLKVFSQIDKRIKSYSVFQMLS